MGDDLELQDPDPGPSKVDGYAERKIISAYNQEAHQKAISAEIDRYHRWQTIKELVVCVVVLVVIFVLVHKYYPEYLPTWLGGN